VTASNQTIELRLPATGAYAIDTAHSSVEFVVRHLGLSRTRGRFSAFTGTVRVAEDPRSSSTEVSIDAGSVHTGDAGRDGHLRSGDFLDLERWPALTFHSTGVRRGRSDEWLVDGELTIRDVTRPVTLAVTYNGSVADPMAGERIAFSATAEIDREDFGLTWNKVLDTGGLLVGRTVRIELEVEAVRADVQ
jgi:polyisoprenoid-binding protein YceI